MFFCDEEGTQSSFKGVKDVIEAKGLFCSLYTDRASHYRHTPEAGGKADKVNLTQLGRAMKQLGVEMIPAYSPQVREDGAGLKPAPAACFLPRQGGLQHQRMFRPAIQRLTALAGQAQAQGLTQLEAPAQGQGAAAAAGHLNTAVGGEQAVGPGHVQAVGPFGSDPALWGLPRPAAPGLRRFVAAITSPYCCPSGPSPRRGAGTGRGRAGPDPVAGCRLMPHSS